MGNKNSLKDLVYKRLKEMSATGGGAGAATFTPGEGANYTTPFAFNPNKKAKGTAHNYYYKLGFKPVNAKELHKKAKGIDHKDLWKENKEETSTYLNQLNLPDDGRKEFITSKVEDFNTIEDKLNTLLPLLKNAKKETMDAYKKDPDFKVMYGTQFANAYLDKLITLFTNKQQ
jgi:hypothetical protein